MNILSLQSHVAFGHVGHSAAVFPMQRLGHDVWPVHTLQFSNHPGYGVWRGSVFDAAMIDDCVEGIAALGVLARCDGVLSGYLATAETGEASLRAVARVKAANPRALYCCDPVFGDAGKLYVAPALADLVAHRAVAAADVFTPNHFELEYVHGAPVATRVDLMAALDAVHARGPRVVVVTSLTLSDTPADVVDTLVSDALGRFRVRTPKLPVAANGAGDTLAALFFVHWLAGGTAAAALESAVSSLYGVLRKTAAAGQRELQTIAAQAEFVTPSHVFAAATF